MALRRLAVLEALLCSCAAPPTAGVLSDPASALGATGASRRAGLAQSALLEVLPQGCGLRVSLASRGVIWAVVDVCVGAAGDPGAAVATADAGADAALSAVAAGALRERLCVPLMLARVIDAAVDAVAGAGCADAGAAEAGAAGGVEQAAKRARLA